MSAEYDFERSWLRKLAGNLERVAGPRVRDLVMRGSEGLSAQSPRSSVISWTREAVERLESLLGADDQREVLNRCACRYPAEELTDLREHFARTGDVAAVHGMLQHRFETFLREGLGLESSEVSRIVALGWGLAGVLEGDQVRATKIPKSGNLRAYLREHDPQRRRALYCHCPRIREVLEGGGTVSPTYCHCGGGYYRALWEEILGRPVRVDVAKSVLRGEDCCSFVISLREPQEEGRGRP